MEEELSVCKRNYEQMYDRWYSTQEELNEALEYIAHLLHFNNKLTQLIVASTIFNIMILIIMIWTAP